MKKRLAYPANRTILVLIDGDCKLCHGITRFVIERDPERKFSFATIQSDHGRKILQEGGLCESDLDTFVMVDHGRYYTKSTAALRLCGELGGLWPMAYPLLAVPAFVRNMVYDFIAANRYRWFGKADRCLLPTEDIRRRFADETVEKGDIDNAGKTDLR
jgi:predicted DCC family thiol-disulfide oxidoreductase YuxK